MANGALTVPDELNPLDFFFLRLSHLDLSKHEEILFGDWILFGGEQHTLSSLTLLVVV